MDYNQVVFALYICNVLLYNDANVQRGHPAFAVHKKEQVNTERRTVID